MTDGRIELIATRWGRITEEDWEDTVNDIRAWGTAPGFVNDISRARGDILSLIEEVRFLRGQLADLCEDSRAVAEVVRLRDVLACLVRNIDNGRDAIANYRPEWRGLDEGLGQLKAIAQRGLEGGAE